jgi:hypothetical protein
MAKVHDLHAPRAAATPTAATPASTPVISPAPTPVSIAPATAAPTTPEEQKSTEKPRPVAADFVCEADVRRALHTQQKIYINEKTIITPAARDAADPSAIFATV